MVWAPQARTVDVVVVGPGAPRREPMRLVGAHKPGYWGADRELVAGTVFGYSIDGADPVADPTGTMFPDGVHGLSRVPDPLPGWTDAGWHPPAIGGGTLLHLDVARATAEGTFDAAARLLPRIARSGVQGVELAPVAAHDENAGPRAGVRLFAVHEPLGGVHGLARFVDAAHGHGLAVVLTPPHRWAFGRDIGLDVFGPYTVDGRLNLAGGGNRGLRDLLSADAERWFRELHVDGLSLDIDVLTDRSTVPYVAELADETVTTSARLGRPLTLFVDGPGRSDRLTGAVRRLLALDGPPDPSAIDDLRRLSITLTPAAAHQPLRADHRWGRRSRPAVQRAAALVIGNITRLPGARRAMPWAPSEETARPGDLDSRSSMLALAMLAGTPVVLDTDHVPVGERSPDADRLLAWCAELAGPRADTVADLPLGLDLHRHGTALIARRGRHAVATAWGPTESRVPLEEVLPDGGAGWELRTAWSPGARLAGGLLVLPARTTAVLRGRC
jgi:maltooligosyltrehalose trehalohydrolase